MATTQITCRDCGAPHMARRSDAKFCGACRLLRVMVYASSLFKRARQCRSCGELFHPMHAKDLSHCGTCESLTRPPAEPFIDCAICGKPGPPALVNLDVRACVACAKHPVLRQTVLKALRKGRKQRTALHRPNPPKQEAPCP